MPVKTINQLRTMFAVDGVSPSEQDYVDLVDTLLYYQAQISSILIPLLPVVVVADEAARLAAGPSLERYRKVKQTDNGQTYVRQQDPGSNPGDWVNIGDVDIVIPDVIQLQTQLDRRLTKLADDATTGQIALQNWYASQHTVSPAGSDELTVNALNDHIILAFRDQDFTILPEDTDPDTVNGTCDVLVKNVSASPIDADLLIPVGIDFVFVLDQSGSMADIRVMMPDLTRGLEARLNALGIGTGAVPNRYAMVEQGSGFAPSEEIAFADYATFLAGTYTFTYPGGTGSDGPFHQEDAYEGIDFAVKNLTWRSDPHVIKLIFFMTDEDRNPSTVGPSTYVWYPENDPSTYPDQASHFAYLKAELLAGGFVLAGLFSSTYGRIRDSLSQIMIAVDYTGRCYKEDGAGGYLIRTGGSEAAGTSSGDNAGLEGFGQYEEYYQLVMDPDIQGYMFDIWAYRGDNIVGYSATDGGNTAEQLGTTVTLTDVGGRTFTSADEGRWITITGAAAPSLILVVTGATTATVHNSQTVTASDFTINARLWQGYWHQISQSGTTVTITTPPAYNGFVFATTALDAGKVIRFATGEQATIVSVTSLTEAEVDVSQTVASTSFITFANMTNANKSLSTLAVMIPALANRIQQELSQLRPIDGVTFPVTIAPGAWRRFRVTMASTPLGSASPGRKLLIY